MTDATADGDPEIRVERREDIALVLLNRGREANPISSTLGKNLLAALDELEADRSVCAIVLSGAGHVFCAGGKMGEMIALDGDGVDPDTKFYANRNIVKAVSRIRTLDLPVICALNGAAVGGGVALALACDLVVASEDASYFFAFGRMGASAADMGCAYLLPRIVGATRARNILLTGAKVNSAQGKDLGLFIDVVPGEQLLDAAFRLARSVVDSAPRQALAATKQVLLRGETTDFEACVFYELYLQSYLMNSDEHKTRLKAFLDHRKKGN